MNKKRCAQVGCTALLLIATLIAGGCVATNRTTYMPTQEDTRDLSRVQAEKLLLHAMQTENTCFGPKSFRLAAEKLSFTCKANGWTRVYSYKDTPILTADYRSVGSFQYSCINTSGQNRLYHRCRDHDGCREVSGQFIHFPLTTARVTSIPHFFLSGNTLS